MDLGGLLRLVHTLTGSPSRPRSPELGAVVVILALMIVKPI
ncbi:MAG TPA: hypothetical protein VH720_07010 [Candidatus Limnocylindrales bacterium]|jgi:hypothetical protein